MKALLDMLGLSRWATLPLLAVVPALLLLACGDDDDDGGPGGAGDAGGMDAGAGDGGQSLDPGGGAPPSAPRLLMPQDGATDVPAMTALCWEPSTDPDGDDVRYRVFVDDLELTEGVVYRGEEGFAGPCTDELLFKHDTTYEWFVIAFDPEHPHVMSGSETFRFTTEWDPEGRVVFEDDFSTDAGWEVSGEASDGQWTFGTPGEVRDPEVEGEPLSQPDGCFRNATCWFTGHNPQAVATEGDVDGGSTVLLSPPFDLTGALSATVSLTRFFYRGDSGERGTRFQVDVLVPDDEVEGGYRVFALDQVDYGNYEGANAWTPVAYAACDLPSTTGTRLRVTATDPGDNVVEAALDNVQVRAHRDTAGCSTGEGSLCDPNEPGACGDGLLCCARGTLNYGVFRCTEPAPAIDRDDFPEPGSELFNGELGCPLPDLVPIAFPQTVRLRTRDFEADDCAVREGCVGGLGTRRLLLFDMASQNFGARALALGVPANHPDLYGYDACHEHFHFDGFAVYRLLDGEGNEAAQGNKSAQCLWDHSAVVWPSDAGGVYSCLSQGLSPGWQDIYESLLDCQWIDVTGVPPGEYTVRIDLNVATEGAAPRLLERDYGNNRYEFPVTIPPE